MGWVVLGSSLTLVIALAVTTYHYRGRARKAEKKDSSSNGSRTKSSSSEGSHRLSNPARHERRYKHDGCDQVGEYFIGDDDRDTLENEISSGSTPGCDRYDLHGVKIEQNCFI